MYSVAGGLKPGFGGRHRVGEAAENNQIWPRSLVLPSPARDAVQGARLHGEAGRPGALLRPFRVMFAGCNYQ